MINFMVKKLNPCVTNSSVTSPTLRYGWFVSEWRFNMSGREKAWLEELMFWWQDEETCWGSTFWIQIEGGVCQRNGEILWKLPIFRKHNCDRESGPSLFSKVKGKQLFKQNSHFRAAGEESKAKANQSVALYPLYPPPWPWPLEGHLPQGKKPRISAVK